jgi:acyclic terpene utilization AtuA family protein
VTIRLAGGQGFYGDAVGPLDDVLAAEPDYVVLEALAELTLAILAKDRARDETRGWTRDLPAYVLKLLPAVHGGRTTVITNAGGINPQAAARMIVLAAREYGMTGLRVATVVGDDVRRHPHLQPEGFPPSGDLLFANAYLGARPVVEALEAGADLVITGRVADAALFLAPLVHRYGWGWRDWDRLAAGAVVGHLLECSGQVSGGNHGGRWWEVPEPWRFGFPLADVAEDGTALLSKPAGTGGAVTFDTVRQQLLYEVADPTAYLTPDVVVDMTTVRLDDLGTDEVRISGATGRPATGCYKVVGATAGNWAADISIAFGWPDAEAKARATADLARKRVAEAGLDVTGWYAELFGVSALHGPAAARLATDPPEVVLRLAWSCRSEEDCARVSRHIVPLGLSGPPPGFASANRSRPRPSQQLRLVSGLVDRSAVDDHVLVSVEQA